MALAIKKIFVESVICLLWALLSFIDMILDTFIVSRKPHHNISPKEKPQVINVGASFAGLAVQRELSYHRDELDVTIVDFKTYFEYVPGALRCFIEPFHLPAITCPLKVLEKMGTTVIRGEVVGVNVCNDSRKEPKNEVILKEGCKIPYDYLVLAAGSTYSTPIKATPTEQTLAERQTQWNESSAKLEASQTIAIIGAGAVGVELAGEILTKYHKTKWLILIDSCPNILQGFQNASIEYATKYLIENGAELILGATLTSIDDDKSVTFANGSVLKVDLLYKCFGFAPNTTFLRPVDKRKEIENVLSSSLVLPKGFVSVNDHLQVKGAEHIFCAGDMCFHEKSNELKLGHTAEVNAHLVAENLLRLVRRSRRDDDSNMPKRDKLLSYPSGVVHNEVTPKIYNISLGEYDATMGFNSIVVNGSLAAILKWLIEWTKVAAAAQRPVGIYFWIIGDAVSNFLARTIIPTSLPKDGGLLQK